MAKTARRSKSSSKAGEKDNTYQLARIVGALCVNASLREAFFGARHLEAAKSVLETRGLLVKSGLDKSNPAVVRAVQKMYAGRRGRSNCIECCAGCMGHVLMEALAMPCPDWPC